MINMGNTSAKTCTTLQSKGTLGSDSRDAGFEDLTVVVIKSTVS
jgi:hypothetical protein